MSLGPGKYDDACTEAREMTAADLVLLVVMGGASGHGFSVQCVDPIMLQQVPELLRLIADQIEKDI